MKKKEEKQNAKSYKTNVNKKKKKLTLVHHLFLFYQHQHLYVDVPWSLLCILYYCWAFVCLRLFLLIDGVCLIVLAY